ncbi:hypothetical protein LZ30DRAFT_4813 [Colletotrichum cereale]|nr:hypothetical protein LZ30DRAFT_4813 [Colletotrichum cereale]
MQIVVSPRLLYFFGLLHMASDGRAFTWKSGLYFVPIDGGRVLSGLIQEGIQRPVRAGKFTSCLQDNLYSSPRDPLSHLLLHPRQSHPLGARNARPSVYQVLPAPVSTSLLCPSVFALLFG